MPKMVYHGIHPSKQDQMDVNKFINFITATSSDITCGKEKVPIPCTTEEEDVSAPSEKESSQFSDAVSRVLIRLQKDFRKTQTHPYVQCTCFRHLFVYWPMVFNLFCYIFLSSERS